MTEQTPKVEKWMEEAESKWYDGTTIPDAIAEAYAPTAKRVKGLESIVAAVWKKGCYCIPSLPKKCMGCRARKALAEYRKGKE